MSFTAATRDRQAPVVPLAGMIDVMFLLLVFFMTASVFREQERQIDVSLPEASSAAESRPRQFEVTVKDDGTIWLYGDQYTSQTFPAKLRELKAALPNDAVVIRGDRNTPLEYVVSVMDMAYAADFRNVFLATTRKGPPR
jgi:biopolymer transport protein ExbD